MTKRIGILTSGGDCAGLNAVIRAVAHRAIEGYGWEVLGIKYGTVGLTQNPKQYCNLTLDMIDGNMLRLGGTILGTTNKGTPQDFTKEILAAIQDLNIDAIIGVGGDGSLKILNDLMKKGNINFIGIPKTIDNDLGSTEISIGFSTAVEVATEALDRLQPTAASHDRVMILEVMGRDAGHIALNAGIAGGADVVLIPEIPYSLDIVANKIKQINQRGRNFALVVVAESVKTENGQPSMITDMEGRKRYGGIGHYLSEKIAEQTKAETRCTVLGHVQRGGQPNASDRVLAAALGIHAVDLIAKNQYSRMVAWQNRQVVDVAIEQAIAQYEAVNVEGTLVRTARGLGICFGDQ
ncbi:MAG: ATP-dependent 6-phosphofructokinase [Alphaproteobacteria bacterium]|nr:ATP-dependent 6-phosphofructokinase [Alphaproteobacteria bacterium]